MLSYYRVAYVFCRALAFYLWWSAVISVLAVVTSALGFLIVPNLGGGMLNSVAVSNLSNLVLRFAFAVLASAFARGISAALVGQSPLEGEAIETSRQSPPEERALVQALGGLLLLVSGATLLIPQIVTLLFYGFGFSGLRNPSLTLYRWSIFFYSVPLLFQAAIGFIFAFRSGLKRLVPR